MKKTFLVVYEKGRKNYSGFAPDVAGCGGLGYTLEGVRADLREGLRIYMDACVEFGQPLPEPTSKTVTVPVEGETDPKVTYVIERLTVEIPKVKTSRPTNAKIKKTATNKRRVMQAA